MRKFFVLPLLGMMMLSYSGGEETMEILRRKVELIPESIVRVGDERIHCTKAVPAFYESRLFKPAWTDVTDARAFIAELRKAGQHGLNPQDYHVDQIDQMLTTSVEGPLKRAELDLLLTDAFLLYASHLISGKVDPANIDPEWHVRTDQRKPTDLLNEALSEERSMGVLEQIRPKSNTYQSLRKALTQYRKIEAQGGWEMIPTGETLKPGMTDARVPYVRKRLMATKDLASSEDASSETFDEELKAAVIKFQTRHGIDTDGNIGAKTVQAMNIPADYRVKQIMANMERWRWLNQEMSPYRVMVNIADYKLEVIKDQQVVLEHKVMVGKPYRRTPVFQSTMQYLVLNPTWTVPPTILKNDVVPAIRKDQGYLATKGMQVLDASGKAVDPSTIDWRSQDVYRYTYRQPAGKSNALGAVKFMFPNSFNVYLHDTPSKELFGKAERAFSSGCIRVEKPIELAKYFLEGDGTWTPEAIDKTVANGRTETIGLNQKPEVYLLYWTAWTDSSGAVQFRTDVYERDQPLIEALLKEDPTALANVN